MTLVQPDFLRPFTVGFAIGALAIAAKFAMEFSGLIA
ncbi:MAG: hypothetical protein RIS17_635 [Pseudomonadota bacterium]|jgi:hypothetical protein